MTELTLPLCIPTVRWGTGFLAVVPGAEGELAPVSELDLGFVFTSWVRWVAGTTFGNVLLSQDTAYPRAFVQESWDSVPGEGP